MQVCKEGMAAWIVTSSTSPLSPYTFDVLDSNRFLNFVNDPSRKIKFIRCSSGSPGLASWCNLSFIFLIMGPFNRRLNFACLHIHANKAASSFGAASLGRRVVPFYLERVAVSCVDNSLISRDMVNVPGVLRSLSFVSNQRARSRQAMLSFSRLGLSFFFAHKAFMVSIKCCIRHIWVELLVHGDVRCSA